MLYNPKTAGQAKNEFFINHHMSLDIFSHKSGVALY
jgi:hypothetical protein